MTRKIIFTLGGILILLLALTAAKFFALQPSVQSVTLADGTTLSLEGISYGTEHPLTDGHPWTAKIREKLPSGWRSYIKNPSRISQSSDYPVLMGWITRRNPAGICVQPGIHRTKVYDAHGCLVFATGMGTSSSGALIGSTVEIPVPPDQHGPPKIEVYDYQNKLLATFTPRLPPRETVKVDWQPKPMPQTVTLGDLDFTLRNIIHYSGKEHMSYAPRFEAKANGVVNTNWSSHEFSLEDTHGNTTYWGGLCQLEPVWKMNVRFFRHPLSSQFSTNELWIATNTVPPAPGMVSMLSGSNRLEGIAVQPFIFGGPGLYTLSNDVVVAATPLTPGTRSGNSFGMSTTYQGTNRIETLNLTFGKNFFGLRTDGWNRDHRVQVRFTDQNGRRHEMMRCGGTSQIAYFDADLPTNSSTAGTIEIIVQKSRKATYFIAPADATKKKL